MEIESKFLVDQVLHIALRAGDQIMTIYGSNFDVQEKADNSPVTKADIAAEESILPALHILMPGIPIVSEEAASKGLVPKVSDCFWLVDPLDGTREFVKRNGEFTVNIALVEHGAPTLGVIVAPAMGRCYAGARGMGAFAEQSGLRRAIACRPPPAAGLAVISSRSHGDRAAMDQFLAGTTIASSVYAGSSLKFCLIAAGEADIYPRLGPTMEWDTAAGHAILSAAGGQVCCLDGTTLAYGKPGFANPHFVATGYRN